MIVEIGVRLFFVVSFISFVGSVLFYPKAEEKLSLLAEGLMSILFVMCFGAVAAGAYKLIKVPVNVGTVSIIYAVPSIILWAMIAGKKKVQKLSIGKREIFSAGLLTVVFLAVELTVFSYEMRPSYNYNTDAGNHLGAALDIVRTGKVSGMYFSAFHNAMLIDLFTPFLEEIKYYKAFVFADSLGYYFQILFIYAMMSSIAKKKVTGYVAPVLAALCWLGYPLYSYIDGHYVYWGWGAVLVCYVFYEIVQCREKKRSTAWLGANLLAGFSGTVLCYNLFAPAVLWVLLIVGILEGKKRKIKFTKKNLLLLGGGIVFCILVALFGYFSFFHGYSRETSILASLRVHGGCYRNLYSDFLWTLPILIVFFIYCFKKKHMYTYGVIYLSLVALQIIVLCAHFAGVISGYYYYKFYYPLWIMHWVVIALTMETVKIEESEKKYVYSYLAVLGISLVSSFGHVEERINELGPEWLTDEGTLGNNLYYKNMEILQHDFEAEKYSTAQFEICQYVMEHFGGTDEIVYFAGWKDCQGQSNWYSAITGMPNNLTYRIVESEGDSWKKLLDGDKVKRYVVLKESALYKDNTEYFNEKNWIFENEEGFIVEN